MSKTKIKFTGRWTSDDGTVYEPGATETVSPDVLRHLTRIGKAVTAADAPKTTTTAKAAEKKEA